jgi:peptide/nickel transport system ATP-binding protein
VIAHIADRIAVMYRGAIVEEGRTDDVLQPPWHPYTEALLSAIPAVDSAPETQRIRLRGDAVERGDAVRGCRFQHRCPAQDRRICETDPPPVTRAGGGHRIACHLPI